MPNRGKTAGGRIGGNIRNQIKLWENASDATNTVPTRLTTSKSDNSANQTNSQLKDAKSFPSSVDELSTNLSAPVVLRDKSP